MTQVIAAVDIIKQLRLKFGIRGGSELGLEESILPVANVIDLEAPPFHSKRGGVASIGLNAVVGSIGYVGLRANANLPDSFRAVIKRMTNNAGSTTAALHIVDNATFDASVPGGVTAPVDASWDGTERPALQTFTASNALSVGGQNWIYPAGGNIPLDLQWVLRAGQTLIAQTLALNLAIQLSYYWDEYNVG